MNLRLLKTYILLSAFCVPMLMSCGDGAVIVQPNPPLADTGTFFDTATPVDTFTPADTAVPGPDTAPPGPDTSPPAPDTVQPDTKPPGPPPAFCENQADGTPCDDSNPLTSGDTCTGGVCQGQLSQAGWHYQFTTQYVGRFSRIRIKDTLNSDLAWSPWITSISEWKDTYMNSSGPPGFYPDFDIQIENDCADAQSANTYTNAALSNWFSTSGSALARPGFLELRNDGGGIHVILNTLEASILSYEPAFGSCQTKEVISMKAVKLKIVQCVVDSHCGVGEACNSLQMCKAN